MTGADDTWPNLVSQSFVYFAKASHEGIGLYLLNVDYRFLEGTSKISPSILLILYYSGHQNIVGHNDFEELQKYTR